MDMRDRAFLCAVLELRAQPILLRLAIGHAEKRVQRDLTVQHEDAPLTQVIRVIARLRVARSRSEVLEIRGGTGRGILMVPDGGTNPLHDPLGGVAPRAAPADGKVALRA